VDDLIEPIGQYLRRKREEKRISVEEVTLQTRIQAVFINAIEEGHFDKIQSLVSLKGFVRSYARFLKVSDVETLTRLSAFLSGTHSMPSAVLPSLHEAKLEEENPAQTSLSPLESVQDQAGAKTTTGLTSEADIILDMGTVGERTRKTPPYAQWIGASAACLVVVFLLKFYAPFWSKKSTVLVPDQTRIETTVVPNTNSPVVTVIPTAPVVSLDTQGEEAISIEPSDVIATLKPFILSLEAREPTWVKVLVDGKGAKDILLQKGQRVVWQADKSFLLTMGNGGGAEVFLDGKELGFLGKRGEVIRDRLLTRMASDQTTIDND
jgi:hypothetical protein